jgi:tetratricopeptide (TPR) repeat protein
MNNLDQAKVVRDSVTKLFSQGEVDAGLRLLKEAGALPQHIELECLGNLHFYKRELQKAVDSYERAIALQPEYAIARYQYIVGIQDEKQNDLVAAFSRYQSAIGIEPTFVDAYFELGGLLVKIGDLEGAAQCYRDAVRLAPHDLAAYHNLSSVLTKLATTVPDKYSEEWHSVDAAYRTLKEGGASLSSTAKW